MTWNFFFFCVGPFWPPHISETTRGQHICFITPDRNFLDELKYKNRTPIRQKVKKLVFWELVSFGVNLTLFISENHKGLVKYVFFLKLLKMWTTDSLLQVFCWNANVLAQYTYKVWLQSKTKVRVFHATFNNISAISWR
jgi:hypothetical protein